MAKRPTEKPNPGPKSPILLDVPFYKQTQDFTCGPASLMMAMAYFDYNIPLEKDLEIDIWREAHPGEVYGTVRYGLVLAALKREFGATIISNTKDIEFREYLKVHYKDLNNERLDFFFKDMRARCKKAGVVERLADVTVEDIYEALSAGLVPIVLMNAQIFTNEDVAHWVVVSGLDLEEGHITVNNPSGDAPETLTLERFHEGFGYRDNEVMVAIFESAFIKKKKMK